jgi:prevent-host-death family protein
MAVFNVHDAKTHLSRLLERVAQGEEIIIAKSGRPIAKLVRMTVEPRRPGRLKGRIRIGPDFDEPLPDEILAVVRGEEDE